MNTLNSVGRHTFLAMASVLVLAGCQQTKSENPLSPSIAGPIAGVEITPPKAVEPVVGKKIKDAEQPVSIVIENPSSTSPRPFTISLQIASDGDFNNLLYTQNGIAPAGEGLTKVRLPERLQAGRVYHWRARAEDGANASGWSAVQYFEVQLNVVIGTPQPASPVANNRTTGNSPDLVVNNGQSSGPHGGLRYQFQVSKNVSFTDLVREGEEWQQGNQTRWNMGQVPGPDMVLYWHARITDGEYTGGWSNTEQFRTPVTPTDPGGGGGGPTPVPGNCKLGNGPAIVACVGAKYPERLRAGISLSERQHNMEFIRDRIIEAGLCSGMNLGYNMKRGGPERSIDFLAMRVGGQDHGVDIGSDYDNTNTVLRLQWAEVGPGAFFAGFGAPNCG